MLTVNNIHCGMVMIIITVVSHDMYIDDVENDQRCPVGVFTVAYSYLMNSWWHGKGFGSQQDHD